MCVTYRGAQGCCTPYDYTYTDDGTHYHECSRGGPPAWDWWGPRALHQNCGAWTTDSGPLTRPDAEERRQQIWTIVKKAVSAALPQHGTSGSWYPCQLMCCCGEYAGCRAGSGIAEPDHAIQLCNRLCARGIKTGQCLAQRGAAEPIQSLLCSAVKVMLPCALLHWLCRLLWQPACFPGDFAELLQWPQTRAQLQV